MNSSEECNKSWENGYRTGWHEYVKSHEPSIPPTEGGVPPGTTDSLTYYFEKGRAKGQIDGLRHNSGLV